MKTKAIEPGHMGEMHFRVLHVIFPITPMLVVMCFTFLATPALSKTQDGSRCEPLPANIMKARGIQHFKCGPQLQFTKCEKECPQKIRAARLRLRRKNRAAASERTLRRMPTKCGFVKVQRVNFFSTSSAHQIQVAFETAPLGEEGVLFCSMQRVSHDEEQACEEILRTYIEKTCAPKRALLKEAQKALLLKDPKGAQLLSSEFLENNSTSTQNTKALLLLGMAWYAMGERGKSSEVFLRALERDATAGLDRTGVAAPVRTQRFFQSLLQIRAGEKNRTKAKNQKDAAEKGRARSWKFLSAKVPKHCKLSDVSHGVMTHCDGATLILEQYEGLIEATAELQKNLVVFQDDVDDVDDVEIRFVECRVLLGKSRCAELRIHDDVKSRWLVGGAAPYKGKAVSVRCTFLGERSTLPTLCKHFLRMN
ncbi:MAG: hypothetical protein GY822_11900 [Deltaproteobacteria bacterium]|nr:hypothetical protein [Deltaproteobacteria bacterium]